MVVVMHVKRGSLSTYVAWLLVAGKGQNWRLFFLVVACMIVHLRPWNVFFHVISSCFGQFLSSNVIWVSLCIINMVLALYTGCITDIVSDGYYFYMPVSSRICMITSHFDWGQDLHKLLCLSTFLAECFCCFLRRSSWIFSIWTPTRMITCCCFIRALVMVHNFLAVSFLESSSFSSTHSTVVH